jgi:hypothetical protein
MDLYQTDHDGWRDKITDMGAGLVCAMVLYAIASVLCVARSADMLIGTDVEDLLTSWPGILVGVAGVVLAALAIGLWCRSRWVVPLALSFHGVMAVLGGLAFRSSLHRRESISTDFQSTLWLGSGTLLVSMFCLWWWNREEPRAWTRAREGPEPGLE